MCAVLHKVRGNMNYYDFSPFMLNYNNARRLERDFEYVKEMYPMKVKCLQVYVEEELDKYEYFGSFIYDEFPDKITIYRIVSSISDKSRNAGCFREEKNDMLDIIIEILVLNEISARRQKRNWL